MVPSALIAEWWVSHPLPIVGRLNAGRTRCCTVCCRCCSRIHADTDLRDIWVCLGHTGRPFEAPLAHKHWRECNASTQHYCATAAAAATAAARCCFFCRRFLRRLSASCVCSNVPPLRTTAAAAVRGRVAPPPPPLGSASLPLHTASPLPSASALRPRRVIPVAASNPASSSFPRLSARSAA